jgi:hypothetical protein
MFQPDFLIIPRQIYSDRSLAHLDREVFAVVYWMERMRDGKCTAANKTIGDILGVEPRSIPRSLKRLEQKGYIKRGFGDSKKFNRSSIATTISFKQDTLFGHGGYDPLVNRGRINTSNKDTQKTSFSVASKKKLKMNEDISIDSNIDEDGNSLPARGSRGKLPKVSKSKVAIGLQRTFVELCRQSLSTTPVMDTKGYFAVLFAMNKGGLSEKQILELFEEWFMNRRLSDEKIAQITWALSGSQITAYKARHQIE